MEKVRKEVHQLGQGRPLRGTRSPGGHGGPSLETEGGIWEPLSPRGSRSVATTAILDHVGIGVAAQRVTAAGPVTPLDQHQPRQRNLKYRQQCSLLCQHGLPSQGRKHQGHQPSAWSMRGAQSNWDSSLPRCGITYKSMGQTWPLKQSGSDAWPQP